ncbi:hypothetical protein ACJ72_04184 [Emergomyces africanus]|uniref:BZIP domain-containing protein n=1 Tax=Emergomyces africanus TaxID=1955775 RepID=A0A1B7NXH8_9EURO|nr:hypothetical protein ACJ72_04184 [Emergomyces africanus]
MFSLTCSDSHFNNIARSNLVLLMQQSSDENKIEEKASAEELAAKERRRLQNRIAQRNHRKKKAQQYGNEEQKTREQRPMGQVDVGIQPSNNTKCNELASEENCRNNHCAFTLSHSSPVGKPHYCGTSNLNDHYRPTSTDWLYDNRIIYHNSRCSHHLLYENGIGNTNPAAENVWGDQDIAQKPIGVTNSQFAEDDGKLDGLVNRSPDFNTPFDGTDSDISSPAAQSYTAALTTIEPCPPLPSAQTPVSEDDLSLIGVPPGWPGNLFVPPRRLRSYSENTGRISQAYPFLVQPESDSEPHRSQGDSEGKMALHLSAENGHASIVRCLLEFGSEIDRRDRSGATALHYAAGTGNVDVITTLLERGADGNITDLQGRTALHIAAERGHEGAVRILIQSGASVDIQIQSKQVSKR